MTILPIQYRDPSLKQQKVETVYVLVWAVLDPVTLPRSFWAHNASGRNTYSKYAWVSLELLRNTWWQTFWEANTCLQPNKRHVHTIANNTFPRMHKNLELYVHRFRYISIGADNKCIGLASSLPARLWWDARNLDQQWQFALEPSPKNSRKM